jgi:hypothetical protein
MLGTVLGCSKPAGQQTSARPVKPGGESVAKSEAMADSEPESEPLALARDEDDIDSGPGLIEHHHHYFELAAAGLSPAQFDRANRLIHWPPVLRDKQFSDVRFNLDQLFDQRTPSNSGMKSENYEAIRQQCEAMLGILARMMPQLNSDEFAGACRFIKGLEEEARLPVQ